MPANAKPGKSTHPYDTGIGNTTATSIRDSRPPTPASHRTKRADNSVGQTPQTAADQLRKNKRVNSASSIRNKIPSHQPSNEHGIKFSSILGLRSNRRKLPNTSPSEVASTPPGQLSRKSEPHAEVTRRESWWSLKRRASVYNGSRDTISGRAKRLGDEEHGSNLVMTSNSRTRSTGMNNRESRYLRSKIMKKSAESQGRDEYRNKELGMRHERSVQQVEKAHVGTEKTEKDELSPGTNTELTKIPGQSWRRRRSISSSQAHTSTAGTSSTPGNVATHRDIIHEEWRHQTPSPIVPTQVLRSLLGSRKSPSPKTGTRPDQEDAEIRVSASMELLGQRSQDDRASGRQSIEQKNRVRVPFWGSPRSQAGLSRHDNGNEASRQKNTPEPSTGDQGQNAWAGQRKVLDIVSRRRWRSG
ncbi:uncharacterized protein F4812DRAFT_412157 [Daldinia caldariorum]|uniref:uncharacterized protein n=1 Tax=Daldinia caldariorum TaxID=326644 RepID=UPI002008126B|nr:uncharacterized protein F4812DRAFT_412157 [Daldinia caldariorum]KAI1473264.1 hypothetical protein F4812DRAFT_412157 [Daldinia caldariorum]